MVTPGPLTTSRTVKEAMLHDWGSRDPEFIAINRRIRERLVELASTEWAILVGSASLVRPGGRLVYATCSVEPEENEQLVARCLERHPELRLVDPTAWLPSGCQKATKRCAAYGGPWPGP